MINFLKKIFVIAAIILIFITSSIFFFFHAYNIFYPKPYRTLIDKKAEEYNIDKYLLTSIIHVESRFKPKATSSRGARGLMQLMPQTAKEIARKKKIKDYHADMLYTPETNIDFGCFYFNQMLKRTNNNPKHALMAYNAGNTNLRKWLKKERYSDKTLLEIAFPETRNYVKDIFTIYRFLNYFKNFTI